MIFNNTIKAKNISKFFASEINFKLIMMLGVTLVITILQGCSDSSSAQKSSNIPTGQSNHIPVFTSLAEFTIDVGVTAVGLVSATDEDSGDALTFSITRGDDKDLFEIVPVDATSVQLNFIQGTGNGEYDVVVMAHDGKVGVELQITAIVGCGSPDPDPSIISDFECQQNYTLISSFDMTELPTVDNLNTSGINTSLSSGEYVNAPGADDSIGITFNGRIDSVIDLTQNGGLTIQVMTPSGVLNPTLSARLQGGVTPVELAVALTANDQWAEYIFDFSEAGGDNTELVLYFNKGVVDSTATYKIDNVKFVSATCPEPDLNIISDFECNQNQTLPVDILTIDNPQKSGINLSSKVGEFTDTPEAWNASVIDFGTAIDLSTHNQLKIKIRAPIAGPLLGKLEGGTSGAKEVWTDIVTTGDWIQYSFDFSDQATANHNKVVLFFNGGVDNAGTDIYQIDDILFDCLTDANVINDFDCQQNQALAPGITVIDNPDRLGINPTAKVGEFTDSPDAWDAKVFDYGTSIDLSANNQLKMKIRAPVAGPLLAKLEGGTSGAKEIWTDIITVGEWVQYTFDFSDQAAADHKKVVFFFNGGVDNAGTDIYQIDDIRFVTQ